MMLVCRNASTRLSFHYTVARKANGDSSVHLSAIASGNPVCRQLQIPRVVAVVGEQQQTLGVVIELSLSLSQASQAYNGHNVTVQTGIPESIEDGIASYA